MKITYGVSLLAGLLFIVQCQGTEPVPAEPGLTLNQLDPEIEQMISDVSADTIEANIRALAGFGTRHTLSDTTSDDFGIGAARRWIKAQMDRYSEDSGGRLQVEFHTVHQEAGGRVPEPTDIVNVVATLPGTDTTDDRIFVVSGHYDSMPSSVMDPESLAPGANDDASGTAAVMEMARVMSQYEYPATLVFMNVAGEEQGLLGARGWAEEAAAQEKNIAAMFTNDIIGNHESEDGALSDPYKVRVFAEGATTDSPGAYLRIGGENDMPTRQLARTIKEVAESYLPDMDVWIIYRRDRFLRGGDHSAFLDVGYPAVRFSEPNEDYMHQHQNVRVEDGEQYGDLPEYVDFDYVARVTRTNLTALANLGRSPAAPENVGINTSQLENNTRLRWESPGSAQLAGFEVLWRETTSPIWQHSEFVGNSTNFTSDLISKDNWIFGVRSVSTEGHVSVPVYPLPYQD